MHQHVSGRCSIKPHPVDFGHLAQTMKYMEKSFWMQNLIEQNINPYKLASNAHKVVRAPSVWGPPRSQPKNRRKESIQMTPQKLNIFSLHWRTDFGTHWITAATKIMGRACIPCGCLSTSDGVEGYIPSKKLTYPCPKQVWKWFSFPQCGIYIVVCSSLEGNLLPKVAIKMNDLWNKDARFFDMPEIFKQAPSIEVLEASFFDRTMIYIIIYIIVLYNVIYMYPQVN